MQSQVFVFVGLIENKTQRDLDILYQQLQGSDIKKLPINFIRKDDSLSARWENASYYISIIKDKDELKDWVQMAEDFELEGSKEPLDSQKFLAHSNHKKISCPNLYHDQHYIIGKAIFDSLKSFKEMKVYFYN